MRAGRRRQRDALDQAGRLEVAQSGAWAMSLLRTGDQAAAARFYGDLFGCGTEAFGPATLFRRPGYVGGSPSSPCPATWVAVMTPDDAPAAWVVDFWIADAEAAAGRAAEHGGAVLGDVTVENGFRRAVLADPGGATFTVSQLLR